MGSHGCPVDFPPGSMDFFGIIPVGDPGTKIYGTRYASQISWVAKTLKEYGIITDYYNGIHYIKLWDYNIL